MLSALRKIKKKLGGNLENAKRLPNGKNIQEVMKKKGWSHEYAVSQMEDARARLGITFREYNQYNMCDIPVEEQKEEYRKILEREEKKKRRKEQKEHDILTVMEKSGWDRGYTVAQIEDAKEKFGITYRDYNKYDFYNIPKEQQQEEYRRILKEKKNKKAQKRKEREEEREKVIAKVMKITGWSYDDTQTKILEARERTGCTFKEYFLYRFYEQSAEEQEKYFLICNSKKLTAKYNVDKVFVNILYDKEASNNYFSDYLRRAWCVNTKISKEEFIEKFADCKKVFYKPFDGHHGVGTEPFEINRENAEEIFDKVSAYPKGVIEEYIVQHPDMQALSPSAVNTVRIVTVSSNTQTDALGGKNIDIAYASLKMGGVNSVVDNLVGGGMVAAVDLETGKLITDAIDEEGRVYHEHPATGMTIKGFQIPFFSEVLKLAEDVYEDKKFEGYLGWDIAITENGPVIIEVNTVPGVILFQLPYVPEKKGMKYLMEKYLYPGAFDETL